MNADVRDEDPLGLRRDRAQPARIYDCLLGGRDNYAVDRRAARELESIFPSARRAAQENRNFMHRATRYLADIGVRQFLDVGTGIPTVPNLHQVAMQATPQARVVYVDNDPIVLAHARALLTGPSPSQTAYLQADMRNPLDILNSSELRETLDITKPIGLSLVALMHFIPDEFNPYGCVATLVDALIPGSYLVMSHMTADFTATVNEGSSRYSEKCVAFRARSHDEFARFFVGFDLVEPGITVAHRWRGVSGPSTLQDADVSFYAGVGRKR